jgi:hypothetical protein
VLFNNGEKGMHSEKYEKLFQHEEILLKKYDRTSHYDLDRPFLPL